MNILDALSAHALQPVRQARSPKRGAEFACACPRCGGSDRFRVWPEQGDGGTWWCRQCDEGGDLIKFLMVFDGMDFKAAAAAVGRELTRPGRMPFEARHGSAPKPWSPAVVIAEDGVNLDAWRGHAAKFVERCHVALMQSPQRLDRLAARGIDAAAAERCHLGWHDGENGRPCAYRDRTAWGLYEELKADGRRKMLWLPRGLVIPCFVDGQVARVRIRRPKQDITPEFNLKYYVIPGSTSHPMLLGADRKSFVVVEAELDAIACHAAAGDVCGAVSVLTSHGKPDPAAHAALAAADCILVSLDADEAGRKGSQFWVETYPKAKRWPVAEAKDPGDAVAAGMGLRAWILAGLPPVYRIAPSVAGAEAQQAAAAATQALDASSPAPDRPKAVPADRTADVDCDLDGCERLFDLLRRYPVKIVSKPERLGIVWHPNWSNQDVIGRISKLLYFDPEVNNYVSMHPAEIVHRGNFWVSGGAR